MSHERTWSRVTARSAGQEPTCPTRPRHRQYRRGEGPGLRRRAWTCEPSRGRGGRRGVLHGRRTTTGVEDFQPCRRYRDQLADRSRPTAMPMRLQCPQKQRLTSKERPPELFLVAVPKLLASVVFPAPVVPITTMRSVFRRRLSVLARLEPPANVSNRSVVRMADLFEESLAAVPEFGGMCGFFSLVRRRWGQPQGIFRTCSTW